MAQYDYTGWNGPLQNGPSPLQQQILQRLQSPDFRFKFSGLRALKSLLYAFYEHDKD